MSAIPSCPHVLMIAPRFFGYEAEIKKCLENKGAIVDWLPDRPYDKAWQLAVLRLLPKVMLAIVNNYYFKKLKTLPISKYNIIFAVNTVTLTPRVIKKIKDLNPGAKYILYMWDSMENRDHVRHILGLFDSTWCFDPCTAIKYGMKFKPLFYLNDYSTCNPASVIYELSFVGSIHSDRYAIINKMKYILQNKLYFYNYLYLRSNLIFWILKIIKPSMWRAGYKEFKFKPISKADLIKIFHQSKVILDIEHPKQRGLTMRTFEALGAKKKMVTTNHQVRDYDFFHPDNIAVIDRKNPVVLDAFWTSPYRNIPDEIYEKYSIDAWVNEILELKKN